MQGIQNMFICYFFCHVPIFAIFISAYNDEITYWQMTNLRIDQMVFFRNLTKIGTDKNKTIYSISFNNLLWKIYICTDIRFWKQYMY